MMSNLKKIYSEFVKGWIEREIARNDRMMEQVKDVLEGPEPETCSKLLEMMEAGHRKNVNEFLIGCGYEPYYK